MANKRRESLPQSDKERADHWAKCYARSAAEDSNVAALFYTFFSAKPTVQRLIAQRFAFPKQGGRPRNAIRDSDWLGWVESYKKALQDSKGHAVKVTDLEAIDYGLKNSGTRHSRRPGERFTSAEIYRIRDAAGRARRDRKRAAKS